MAEAKKEKYIEAVGRRKSAVARVRLVPKAKSSEILINNDKIEKYFEIPELRNIISAPLEFIGEIKTKISVLVRGGGKHAQAEAVRHGISRAIEKMDGELRGNLKSAGYLTRDPREKERKKPGLRGARRAPQWSKR